jgi:hypothetical protein
VTARSPRAFANDVAQTRSRVWSTLDELPALYREAHDAAHERIVGDSVGKIMSGGVSDPTATIVGDPMAQRLSAQAALRRVLEQAPKRLAELENAAAILDRQIRRAMDRLDPAEGFVPLRFPRTASEADLDEARAAQRRRASGEGTG